MLFDVLDTLLQYLNNEYDANYEEMKHEIEFSLVYFVLIRRTQFTVFACRRRLLNTYNFELKHTK